MKKLQIIICASIAWTLIASNAWANEAPNDIIVIANKGVTDSSISMEQLRSLFMKKRKTFQSGKKAIPIHATANSPLRNQFIKVVVGITPTAERRYWENQKVKRGLTAPPEMSSTQKAVFKIKGAISYVFRKDYKPKISKKLLEIPAK